MHSVVQNNDAILNNNTTCSKRNTYKFDYSSSGYNIACSWPGMQQQQFRQDTHRSLCQSFMNHGRDRLLVCLGVQTEEWMGRQSIAGQFGFETTKQAMGVAERRGGWTHSFLL